MQLVDEGVIQTDAHIQTLKEQECIIKITKLNYTQKMQ